MPYRELSEHNVEQHRLLFAELADVRDVVRRLKLERDAARARVAELEAELARAQDITGWPRWHTPREVDEVKDELDAATSSMRIAEDIVRIAEGRASALLMAAAEREPCTTLADALAAARTVEPTLHEAAELVAAAQREEIAKAIVEAPLAVSSLPAAERAVAIARCNLELLHAAFTVVGRAGAYYAEVIASALEHLRAAGTGPGVVWHKHVITATHAYTCMLL